MIKCRVCGKEFENQQFLSTHLSRNKKDHPTTQEYFEMYKDDFSNVTKADKKCKLCGNDSEFINVCRGYKNYCSRQCSLNDPKRIDKRRKTCEQKYGTSSYSGTEEYKSRYKKTCLEKYGVENPFQAEECKEKIRNTNIEKYGVEQPMQSSDILDKSKQTCLEKYGTENISKSKYFKNKMKKTCLEKYGVDNPFKVQEFKDKYVQTIREKFGIKNITNISQVPNIKEKIKNKHLDNFYNNINTLSRFVDNNLIPLISKEEYVGTKNETYRFKCTICNTEFESRIDDGQVPRCQICKPYYVSKLEIDIRTYIESIYNGKLIFNDRSIIGPLELDIVIPDLKLAIEVNGIFWHSDEMKPVGYHENKTNKCKEVGYELIYIWEDDWDSEQKLVKELLENIIINNGELYV